MIDDARTRPGASLAFIASLLMQDDRRTFAHGSAARMVLCVQGFQAFAGDMRVDLRRRYVRMAEQQLNDTQVGAVVEKVTRRHYS